MSGFDQAAEVCKDWPDDLTAPRRLRELIDRLEGRDGGEAIGFIELLQAGAETQQQLEAYQEAFDDFELRFDDDEAENNG